MKIVKRISLLIITFWYLGTGASAYFEFSLYLVSFYQRFCVPKIYNSFKLLITKAHSSLPQQKIHQKENSQWHNFSCNREIRCETYIFHFIHIFIVCILFRGGLLDTDFIDVSLFVWNLLKKNKSKFIHLHK